MAKDELKTGYRLIGTRPNRPDGLDKVTGRARYGADFSLPGMLHAAVVRSPHAHARIVKIDASKALALDGVKAVVTRADLPTGLTGEDLNLQDNTLAGEKALYDGHAVAAVAATSALLAQDAARLIEVTYEVLPHVTDVDAAMAPGAPVIRPGVADYSVPEGMHGNVARYMEFGHGDVEAGFAAADIVREQTYRTEATHQGYIEPHAAVAQMGEDGRGEMWVCTQGHWYIRRMCAAVLGIEAANLRVTPSEIGGGFGGKEDMSVQHQAALCAYLVGRPVKVKFDRTDSLNYHPKRHAMKIDIKLGCDSNGILKGMRAKVVSDTGAYGSLGGPVLQRACTHLGGPYNYQNVDIVGDAVYTNNPPAGAFRGFGVTQSAIAIEPLLNELARKVGIDAWEMRYRNAIRPGQALPNGQIVENDAALVESLAAGQLFTPPVRYVG